MNEIHLKLSWSALWTGFLIIFIASFVTIFFALITPLSGQVNLVNGFNFLMIPGVGIHWVPVIAFILSLSALGGIISYFVARKNKSENGIAMAFIGFIYGIFLLALVSQLLLLLSLLLKGVH